MAKRSVGYRLTEDAIALLAALAKALGISQTAAIEVAIRDAAKARGVAADASGTKAGRPKPKTQ